jgi:hypothetical protein
MALLAMLCLQKSNPCGLRRGVPIDACAFTCPATTYGRHSRVPAILPVNPSGWRSPAFAHQPETRELLERKQSWSAPDCSAMSPLFAVACRAGARERRATTRLAAAGSARTGRHGNSKT